MTMLDRLEYNVSEEMTVKSVQFVGHVYQMLLQLLKIIWFCHPIVPSELRLSWLISFVTHV